ncbi:hypothetical protein ACHAQA_006900 [Verticillium albo-atrum]
MEKSTPPEAETSGSAPVHAPAHAHTKEHRDPNLDLALPYRTLTSNANLAEYTTEDPRGEIPGPPVPSSDGTAHENYKLVTFQPNDPENPRNWSTLFRWYCTLVVALTCFVVALCSSIITADIVGVSREFGVSQEVALVTVGTTLFVAVIFIIPCAVADNIATLIVCRTIDGIAFSAPMTLVGGTLADLWRNEERGVPMAAFSAAPFMGPAIGPLVGGFLSDALGWRWLYWLQLILAFVVWVLITFTVPETYTPTILARRAARLRAETSDPTHVTEQDIDPRPLSARLGVFLIRPFQLLFQELIVLLISAYMSVLYGLLYMFFVAYPIVYQKGKGWSAGSTGLMFIPIAVGVLCSAACAPMVNKHYLKLVAKHNGHPPAEVRLVPMMVSCWFIPVGLLIFAWTSYEDVHWIGPALGGFPVGFGFIFLYNSANNYLVDSYQHQAASALAAKTCIRSFWGAAVVLFTEQMYDRLGDQWASTLLAGIGLLCCGIPFLFWKYGARIREKSKYAYSGDDEENTSSDEMRGEKTAAREGPLRSEEQDEDLRRARSYVSNP